jgi:ankyrin repeat protein
MSHAIGTIRLLLASNPNTVNAQDKQAETALHYAIRSYARRGSKYSDTVKILCENGADAGLRDRNGQTPLHCLGLHVPCSLPIDMDLIALLLAHGADVGDTDADGNTPLHLAARNLRYVEAVRFLLS